MTRHLLCLILFIAAAGCDPAPDPLPPKPDSPPEADNGDADPVDPDVAAVIDAIRRTYPDSFDSQTGADDIDIDSPVDDPVQPPATDLLPPKPTPPPTTPHGSPSGPADDPPATPQQPTPLDIEAIGRGTAAERLDRLIATLTGMGELTDGATVDAARLATTLETIRTRMVAESAQREPGADLRLSELIGLLDGIDHPTDDQQKLRAVLKGIAEGLAKGQPAIPREFTTPGADPFYFAWRRLANHYRAGDAAEALLEARRIAGMLRRDAPLEIRNPAFVREVEGFGAYTPAEMPLRAEAAAMVYMEVENFSHRQTGDTVDVLLKVRLDVLDQSGRLVRGIDIPAQSYKARRELTDYFHAPRFRLPQELTPGRYILKIVVEDRHTERFTEERIEFEVQ